MIITDLSRPQQWVAAWGFNNQFTCTFTLNSAAFDISAYTFRLNIRAIGAASTDPNLIELTQVSGITNGGASGILTVNLTAATSETVPLNSYFYFIEYTVGGLDYRLLHGTLDLTNEYQSCSPSTSVNILTRLQGTNVNLAITLGSSGSGGSQDLEEVLTEGNDAGGLKITNLGTPTANSDAATKAYADALVTGLWDDRGNFDASVNAYPSSGGSGTAGAILKGDIWTISVAGTLPTGQAVEIGDTVRALVDTPGNTQANWAIAQQNIGYTAENSANKVSSIGASATQYPNNNAVIAYAQPLDSDLTTLAGLTATTDNFIQSKSSAWSSRTLAQVRADILDTKRYARFYSDFGAMLAPYVNSASGTGATAAISSIAGTATHPGTATCQTGSTSSGQAYITLSASFNNFLLGGGSWFFDTVLYINVLPVLAERFITIVGYHDSPSTSDATDGCYFRQVDDVNGGRWQAITRSNSVETGTVTDTGVSPSAATFQRFTIEVNAGGTQVTYYINGTQVAQHSANIPTGASRQATWCAGLRKTAGSTAMSVVVDYINTINELTTAR